MQRKKRRKLLERRSNERARMGHIHEKRVLEILQRAAARGHYLQAYGHNSHSVSDHAGKDITIEKMVNQKKITISIGVTISERRWEKAKIIHPDVPQLHTPVRIQPEDVLQMVDELFKKAL